MGNYGIMYVAKEVLPKVVSLAKNYPRVAESALKIFINSADELVAFMSECSYFKGNAYSAFFTFGILSVISLGKNYRRYLEGEFSFKNFVQSTGTQIAVYVLVLLLDYSV